MLAGCAAPGGGDGGDGGSSPATPATPAAYPDLARVPARPRLGYTVEQRREIAAGLVADRANARYREAELLAPPTDRADAPPAGAPAEAPAAAAPPPAPAPPQPTPGEATLARAYVDSSLNAASDDGDLRDFMKRIERDIPDPYGPKAVTQAVGLAPPPQASEGSRAPAEGAGGFGGFLGGLLGVEGEAPPPARP